MLQVCVLKSSFLENAFILCEHGTTANIGGAKMTNNRHAINRNFLQSYWTSDGISLYSSQHTPTYTVKDLSRSGKPHVTSQREDSALQCLVRWMPLATSPFLKTNQWLPNRRLSARTVMNRLELAGLKSSRVINRPCYQIDINDYVWHGASREVV